MTCQFLAYLDQHREVICCVAEFVRRAQSRFEFLWQFLKADGCEQDTAGVRRVDRRGREAVHELDGWHDLLLEVTTCQPGFLSL